MRSCIGCLLCALVVGCGPSGQRGGVGVMGEADAEAPAPEDARSAAPPPTESGPSPSTAKEDAGALPLPPVPDAAPDLPSQPPASKPDAATLADARPPTPDAAKPAPTPDAAKPVDAAPPSVDSARPVDSGPAYRCPCSIWSTSPAASMVFDDPDAKAGVELGVRWRAAVAGRVVAIRFYKAANAAGTHVVTLWTDAGKSLGTASLTAGAAEGWQVVNLPTPVDVAPGDVFVASYYATTGRYALSEGALAAAVEVGPLATVAGGNGRFKYGASAFPTETYRDSNYWVDVVFETR